MALVRGMTREGAIFMLWWLVLLPLANTHLWCVATRRGGWSASVWGMTR